MRGHVRNRCTWEFIVDVGPHPETAWRRGRARAAWRRRRKRKHPCGKCARDQQASVMSSRMDIASSGSGHRPDPMRSGSHADRLSASELVDVVDDNQAALMVRHRGPVTIGGDGDMMRRTWDFESLPDLVSPRTHDEDTLRRVVGYPSLSAVRREVEVMCLDAERDGFDPTASLGEDVDRAVPVRHPKLAIGSKEKIVRRFAGGDIANFARSMDPHDGEIVATRSISTMFWGTTTMLSCWARLQPPRPMGRVPSGSTCRSSTLRMEKRPRSGAWPKRCCRRPVPRRSSGLNPRASRHLSNSMGTEGWVAQPSWAV